MIYEYINDYDINPKTNLQDLGLEWSGANGFCFDENGKVAIVWEDEKGYWCLPGGGKENNEIPAETFLREVKEEVSRFSLRDSDNESADWACSTFGAT